MCDNKLQHDTPEHIIHMCEDGGGERTLCDNGAGVGQVTFKVRYVTCPRCLELIAARRAQVKGEVGHADT